MYFVRCSMSRTAQQGTRSCTACYSCLWYLPDSTGQAVKRWKCNCMVKCERTGQPLPAGSLTRPASINPGILYRVLTSRGRKKECATGPDDIRALYASGTAYTLSDDIPFDKSTKEHTARTDSIFAQLHRHCGADASRDQWLITIHDGRWFSGSVSPCVDV